MNIEQREAKFDAATPAEKRVMIALDVIERIENKQFLPFSGRWVRLSAEPENFNVNQDIRDLLCNNEITCSCCALGSLMLSCVGFKNNVSIGDYEQNALSFDCIVTKSVKDRTNILQYFEAEQLEMIEMAFERGCGYYRQQSNSVVTLEQCKNTEKHNKAVAFGEKYSYSDDRLMAIMNNIISNNGEFIP